MQNYRPRLDVYYITILTCHAHRAEHAVTCAYNDICRHVLNVAAKHHPNEWWWLKGNGCDLVVSLGESMESGVMIWT